MCFNPTASLIAFSIGFISFIILLYLKIYTAAIIVFDLFIIQLLEYYAHTSIINKDKSMNEISSKLIYIFVFSQPLIFYLSSLISKVNFVYKNANNYLFLLPIYIILLIIFYFYLNSKKLFKTTYLNDSCKSICRLSWDFFSYNIIFSTIIGILYFAIMVIFWKKSTLKYYGEILILIAFVYTVFLTRQLKSIFSIFGSIWCFLSVTYGPLVIMKHCKLI
jgi:hypothetical protein